MGEGKMRFIWTLLVAGLGAMLIATGASAIETKSVKIYNNTPKKIYAIIEIGKHIPLDEWMQGYFQTTNVKKDTFESTSVYRVYVNPNKGIKPGASVTIDVPFWSQLVSSPKPSQPNQYIDWWNGGRVLVYDQQANLLRDYNLDVSNPVQPLTEGPSCSKKSVCEPLDIFASDIGLPATDPNQLTEYTFSDVVTANGAPYPVDFKRVDYDLSYVDQVYLPTAMGPVNNQFVGYTGTVQDLPGFRKVLHRFLNTWQGWPIYVGNPTYPEPRIPGAYNALVGGSDLTELGVTIQEMKDLWKYCTKKNDNTDLCKAMRTVNDLFQKNYAKYQTLDCEHVKLTDDLLIRHVYGWVEFNEHCKNAFANQLKDTPKVDYAAVQRTYIHDLQYAPNGEFNPYVQLIHSNDFLAMKAYAFSIDDAVGNMNEPGDGVIVAVGGPEGLENKRPFDPSKKISINLGGTQKGFPKWTSYGICSKTPTQDLNPEFTSFAIYSVDYPCTITVADSDNKLYQFTIRNEPPDPKVVRCAKSTTPEWCEAAAQHVKHDKIIGWVIETQGTSQ
jgi:hypothetical protein